MDNGWNRLRMSGRGWRSEFERAIQGDLIRGFVEIITNSIDSYSRLGTSGNVEVFCQGNQYRITDWAEGMAPDWLNQVLQNYSERFAGDVERGIFGRGAKDALYLMKNPRIYTFKDGTGSKAELDWIDHQGNIVGFENSKGMPAHRVFELKENVNQVRLEYMQPGFKIEEIDSLIQGNGTSVEFNIPSRMSNPRPDTIINYLRSHYMLRKINTSDKFKIIFVDSYGKSEIIRYTNPSGELKVVETDIPIVVNIKNNPVEIFVDIKIWKSEESLKKITKRDYRAGGLLVVDENDSVLDLQLFDYENNPYAEKIFGEIKIKGWRRAIDLDETLLDDRRTGLRRGTDLYYEISSIVEDKLGPIIDEEREKSSVRDINRTQTRIQNAISEINKIVKECLQSSFSTGSTPLPTEIPNGIAFYVGNTVIRNLNVTEGNKNGVDVHLLIDTRIFESGTKLTHHCSSKEIEIKLSKDSVPVPKEETFIAIVNSKITATTAAPDTSMVEVTTLDVNGNPHKASLEVHALEVQAPLIQNGFAFVPDFTRIVEGRNKKLYLWIDTNSIKIEPILLNVSDAENVKLISPVADEGVSTIHPDYIQPLDQYADWGIFVYEITVQGLGIGKEYTLTATMGNYKSFVTLKVVSSRSSHEKGGGLFKTIKFTDKENPRFKYTYSLDGTERIIKVHSNNRVINHYLNRSDTDPGRQAMIADAVSECVCEAIVQVAIDTNKMILSNPQNAEEEISIEKSRLYHEYGLKLHNILSDPEIFEEFKSEEP